MTSIACYECNVGGTLQISLARGTLVTCNPCHYFSYHNHDCTKTLLVFPDNAKIFWAALINTLHAKAQLRASTKFPKTTFRKLLTIWVILLPSYSNCIVHADRISSRSFDLFIKLASVDSCASRPLLGSASICICSDIFVYGAEFQVFTSQRFIVTTS